MRPHSTLRDWAGPLQSVPATSARGHPPETRPEGSFPCFAPTRPAPCVPGTPARPSPSPAGWRAGAITAEWPSSTCATRSGVVQVVARDEVLAGAAPTTCAASTRPGHRRGQPRPRGQRQPRPADRRGRGRRLRDRGAQPERRRCRSRSTSASRSARRPASSTATSTCAVPAPRAGRAIRLRSKVERRPRAGAGRAGLRRDRDPHADPLHARGCPRLPRAGPAPPGQLVRPAAEPPAVQAAAHGRRHGALLPDRPLLPRRGLPRRPAA